MDMGPTGDIKDHDVPKDPDLLQAVENDLQTTRERLQALNRRRNILLDVARELRSGGSPAIARARLADEEIRFEAVATGRDRVSA